LGLSKYSHYPPWAGDCVMYDPSSKTYWVRLEKLTREAAIQIYKMGDAIRGGEGRLTIHIRRKGFSEWVSVVVDLASANGQALAVSAESGLASAEGFRVNAETGRMQLLLLKHRDEYRDIATGNIWEVSPL